MSGTEGVSRVSLPSFVLSICLAGTVVGSAAERWRFLMTCDSRGSSITGTNEQVLTEQVNEALARRVDLMIFPGDLVYGARISPPRFEDQLRNWVRAMEPLYRAGVAVYACRGNHEVGDAWDIDWGILPDPVDNYSTRWLNVFGQDGDPGPKLPGNGPANAKYMSYSVVHKNALLVAVDEYGGMRQWLAHSVDQAWLDSVLRDNTKPHVFVFGHEPAFQVLHPDCLDDHPAQRDAFWRSLKASGARTYFCGHDHFYNHARIDDGDGDPNNDVHQLVAATAGGPRYSWTPPYAGDNGDFSVSLVHHAEHYGYIVVEVNDLDVTLTWMERRDDDLRLPGVYEAKETWGYRVPAGPVVLQPNGGERLPAGRPYTVRWRTIDGVEIKRVLVEYSLDGGENWVLVDEVSNTGTHEWIPPAADSGQALVRVRDADNGALSDTSDSLFSIAQCQNQLAADVNGDCRVDFADLAILASQWLAGGHPPD